MFQTKMKQAHIIITAILISINSAVASKNTIQIPKFCPVGEVLTDFVEQETRPYECMEVKSGVNWTGVLYDSETLERLSPSMQQQAERIYKRPNLTCVEGDWYILSAKPSLEDDEQPL